MRRFSNKSLFSALGVTATMWSTERPTALLFSAAFASNSTATSSRAPVDASHGYGASAAAEDASAVAAMMTTAKSATSGTSSAASHGTPRRRRGDRKAAAASAPSSSAKRNVCNAADAESGKGFTFLAGGQPRGKRQRRQRAAPPEVPQVMDGATLLKALTTVDMVARGQYTVTHTKSVPSYAAQQEEGPSSATEGGSDYANGSLGADTASSTAQHASAERLLAQVTASDIVVKLQEALSSMVAPLTGWWTRGPSDSTVRHMERQLDLAIGQGSLEAYSSLRETMRRRLEDPLSRCAGNERLLLLYARLLVNYGSFCLLNCEPQRAISLFREAIATTQAAETAASAAAAKQQQVHDKRTTAKGKHSNIAEASAATTSEAVEGYAETSVLYIRVLLANALACERLFWQAAEQFATVLRVLDQHPCDFMAGETTMVDQLAPGPHTVMPLSRHWIREEARQFFSDAARLRTALSQAQAHELLLQSQGAAPQVLSALHLAMARVCRHGSLTLEAQQARSSASRTTKISKSDSTKGALTPAVLLRESRELYEAYLDDLVSREEEDGEHAMLELGRMLCARPAVAAGEDTSLNDAPAVRKQLEAGLIYLEAASEVLLEEAELALANTQLTRQHKQRVVRAAAVLVDTAEAHLSYEDEASALGLLEGALSLMNRAGLDEISAWVLRRYADTLASVSFVDKAILKYTAAMELLRENEHYNIGDAAAATPEDGLNRETAEDDANEPHSDGARVLPLGAVGSSAPLQLGPQQAFVSLTSLDVEASLAYCYQVYVGDPRRALWHYQHVLDTITSSGKRAVEGTSSGRGVRRRGNAQADHGTAVASIMPMEREHFVLTNMVACCERMQSWDAAVAAQNRLIALEAALGGNAVAACMRSVALMGMKGDYQTMLGVLFYLLLLPAESVEPSVRLTVTHYFVKCCYALGNQTMGSILLNAMRQMEGDHNVAVLLEWALNAEKLSGPEKLSVYDAVDMRADIGTIADTFLRAAQLLVAHRVSDEADRRRQRQSMAAAAAAATAQAQAPHIVNIDASDDGAASAGAFMAGDEKVSRTALDAERDSLITLSRGAFFFHQNGYTRQAEELYATAVRLADEAAIPQVFDISLPADIAERYHEYNRELAILLANFATLKLSTDATQAEALYLRAAAIRPAPLEVAEVVADFFVQSGNYVQGAAHMARVIEAHPQSAAEMHGKLARLGCGHPWQSLTAAQRLEVQEHLVLGLGVAAAALPSYAPDAPTTEANLEERVRVLDALCLDGVSTTPSDEAACLACFFIQTKYPSKPKLINQMYRRALRRFPFHTAILVNYAKFCCDFHQHALARKLYARAYGASDGDFCRTVCYANYLSHAFGRQQVAAGAALYDDYLQRDPTSSEAHMHYGNYLAVMVSAPVAAERHFEKGIALEPQSKHYGLYAQFLWSCADAPAAYQNPEIRTSLFDRAEALFRRAVDIEPRNAAVLQNLGTFYANRRHRFEDAVQTLYQAHKLAPGNAEVTRLLGSVLLEECVRLQTEEQQRDRGAAKQGTHALTSPLSPRLRALTESAQQVFEKSIELDPNHRETLEQYAMFAVTFLKDSTLAAELWKRSNRLGPK